MDIPALAALLQETEQRHGIFENTHVEHNWSDWYAAYINARQQGSGPDQASAAADTYLDETLHVARR